jgi:hypothetical protein
MSKKKGKKKTQPLKGDGEKHTTPQLQPRFGYLVSANWNQVPLWMIVEVVDRC